MGNLQTRNLEHRKQKQSVITRDIPALTNQFSLSHFIGNTSGRSFVSITSNHSVHSVSRPWSRVSRRRWHESTLNSPLEASKTAWPVAHQESIFLPEFPITADLLQKDFEIVETIAKGAFGEVFKVRKVSEDKEYALKVLSKSQLVHERAVAQVKAEARIQTVVGHHSFIAGATAHWQTKKRLYIVSEYIPGGELLALLDRCGKLPEDIVKVFVAEIAIALDFLHNAGIIYRDLKPENILLDADCHIKLIDFGLSKWLSIGSRTDTLCGTLRYMAPEILQGEAYGHAVDWWSLGVLTCRMLTGEFSATAAILEKEVNEKAAEYEETRVSLSNEQLAPGALPPNADRISKPARGLLLRLLERNPRYRLKSLKHLQESAFYMRYRFEDVKEKKISPKYLLDQYQYSEESLCNLFNTVTAKEKFADFDQKPITLLNIDNKNSPT